MLDQSRPRIVLVTRPTWLEELLDRHGTLGQAEFYLKSRGQTLAPLIEAHERFEASFKAVRRALPSDQRRAEVTRDGLDRFLFAPDDVVMIVGQDGLVPNTAKYLDGQLTIGINPDPERFDGVLCPNAAEVVPDFLEWLEHPDHRFFIESRVLAEARREDGQRLLALNEVFIGHHSHQSARYRLSVGGKEERQSSSGIICSTGTGATGWARSLVRQWQINTALPVPSELRLAWFVREPWPSVYTSAELSFGMLRHQDSLIAVSEMQQDGVVFADGIESDRLEFNAGQRIEVGVAERRLRLVVPPPSAPHPRER